MRRRHGQGSSSPLPSPHVDTMDRASLARRRNATDTDKERTQRIRIATVRSALHTALRHDERGEDGGGRTIERQERREETRRGEKRGDERDGDEIRRDAERDGKRKKTRRGGTGSGEQDETAQRGRMGIKTAGFEIGSKYLKHCHGKRLDRREERREDGICTYVPIIWIG